MPRPSTLPFVGIVLVTMLATARASDGNAPGIVPVDVDAVAVRAFARSQPANGGVEVPLPAPGQEVFFHLSFRIEGAVEAADVSLRASLDGAPFCEVETRAQVGTNLVAFCGAGWTAAAGAHTLRWEVDLTGLLIADSDPSNDATSIDWTVGGAADLRLFDAHLRTQPNGGGLVSSPQPGQEVYLHVRLQAQGVPPSSRAAIRAELDGEVRCSGPITLDAESARETWCPQPWAATAGPHTLRWTIDTDDVVAESDESNNEATVSWVSQPSTPPPATGTFTHSPVHTATRDDGASTATPTPTPESTVFPDFFRRGDADCDLARTAADVVAHLRGIDGASLCGNDDCDRDGATSAADVGCSALCLFGDCPIVADAPEVDGVIAASASDLMPLSLVRIQGRRLMSPDGFLQVRVGDRIAGVVEASEDELLVLLPGIEPGSTELVVLDGEASSRRFSLEIAAPVPIGSPDGLADALAVLDDALGQFLSLDLDLLYEEQTLPLIVGVTENLRMEVADFQLRHLDTLPVDLRADLDRLVDGSGVVDAMRAELVDGRMRARVSPRGAAGVTRQVVTRIAAAAGEVTKQYSQSWLARLASSARQLAGPAASLAAAIAAAREIWNLPESAFSPVIVGTRYVDADGIEREHPTAGGTIRVRGCRIGRGNTRLKVKLGNGETVTLPRIATCSDEEGLEHCPQRPIPPFENGCVEYELPDTVGFCGAVDFLPHNEVLTGRVDGSPVRLSVQPEVIAGDMRDPGRSILADLVVRGIAGCPPPIRLLWKGPNGAEALWENAFELHPRLGQPSVSVLSIVEVGEEPCTRRELAPGSYRPIVELAAVASPDDGPQLDIRSRVSSLRIDCAPETISISHTRPASRAICRFRPATLLRGNTVALRCFPIDTDRVDGRIDDLEAVRLGVGPPDPETGLFTLRTRRTIEERFGPDGEAFEVLLEGRLPGTVTLTGAVYLDGDRLLAENTQGVEVQVVDVTPPEIASVDPCDGTVRAGDTLRITARALDNFLVSRLVTTLPAGASPAPIQQYPCAVPDCAHTFEFVLEPDLTPGPLVVEIEAVDGSGLSSVRECEFTVDASTPEPTSKPTGTPTAGPTFRPTPPPLSFTPEPCGGAECLKMVDSDTIYPGTDATFNAFGDFAIDDGTVLFEGLRGTASGLYLNRGDRLQVIYDSRLGELNRFAGRPENASIDAGFIVFSTSSFDESCDGVVTIDSNIYVPGAARGIEQTRICDHPQAPELGEEAEIFFAQLSGNEIGLGVATGDGATHALYVMDRDQVGITRRDIGGLDLSTSGSIARERAAFAGGGAFAFLARTPEDGPNVYRSIAPGPAELVADRETVIPGDNPFDRTFDSLGCAALDGTDVAFLGLRTATSLRGVYLFRNGERSVLVERGTPLTDGRTLHDFFCGIAFDSGNLAFRADASGDGRRPGLFVMAGGQVFSLVERGDVLGGKVVRDAELNGDRSLEGNQVVFRVHFDDFSSAVYRATF